MEDLLALYRLLTDVSGPGDSYVARVIGGRGSYRIAKDADGNPALLISLSMSSNALAIHPIELRNISFRPRCICNVRFEESSVSEEILAVLKCTTDDTVLREYFLRSVSGIVAGLPEPPEETDVAGAVGKLIELFRALESPPRTSLQGVWCELFLIWQASSIRQAAAAWACRSDCSSRLCSWLSTSRSESDCWSPSNSSVSPRTATSAERDRCYRCLVRA